MTGQAGTALARPSQDRGSSSPKRRSSEGLGTGQALDPGRDPRAEPPREGTRREGKGQARTGAHELRAQVPAKVFRDGRMGMWIAGEGGTPSPRPMGAIERSGCPGPQRGPGRFPLSPSRSKWQVAPPQRERARRGVFRPFKRAAQAALRRSYVSKLATKKALQRVQRTAL